MRDDQFTVEGRPPTLVEVDARRLLDHLADVEPDGTTLAQLKDHFRWSRSQLDERLRRLRLMGDATIGSVITRHRGPQPALIQYQPGPSLEALEAALTRIRRQATSAEVDRAMTAGVLNGHGEEARRTLERFRRHQAMVAADAEDMLALIQAEVVPEEAS